MNPPSRVRIIGLGNPLRGDDGIGTYVARRCAEIVEARELSIDVIEAGAGGMVLLDLLTGWQRVIIVDALMAPGLAPGEVVRLDADQLPDSQRLAGTHDMDLATVLALGRRLGSTMPKQVVVYGVQATEFDTFSERLSGPVAKALPKVVELVLDEATGEGLGTDLGLEIECIR